jgi:hypothetical protein
LRHSCRSCTLRTWVGACTPNESEARQFQRKRQCHHPAEASGL